ncbi:flagellar filament capping protein FliD [Halomonas halmophila]|uniref:Flagellar hook-associated protein 2 n=1 Tax=Halomonas halmophila TaxID=252 RepID=A0A4Y4F0B8_9GAMM|nr:flagellar filament capping protein FliD [Halomonas halmophila]GED22877.1 flagellar hook-associated protein 2 [Halomonas halmophila]
MASISSLGIGSGMDLNGLLDQLKSAEREQLEPITAQQQSYEAKVSAYGKLKSALSSFQDAAAKLNGEELYQSLSSNVTGDSVTATASSEAQAGRYDVSVDELARAQSLASQGFAERDAELGAGSLTIEVGTGDAAQTLNLDIAQADSSLEGIRDAINAEGTGVTASIVNDGKDNPYRLVLTSDKTGTESTIQSVDFASDASDGTLDAKLSYGVADATMEQTVQAKDAALTVNGLSISSQSNQVEGAIQGVTLEIAETGDSTVEVELNNRDLREGVSGFVDAYNSLRGTIDSLTSFNAETGEAGELLGDSTLRGIESRLRDIIGGEVGGGELNMLSEVGIDLEVEGTLTLDDDALDETIMDNRQALAGLFAGTGSSDGLTDTLDTALESMLKEGGTLDIATSGVESRIEGLNERYTRMEGSIDRTIERYRSQFSQLDGMIANMNQTSTYLSQQFSALSG